jgi:hypothetical protein
MANKGPLIELFLASYFTPSGSHKPCQNTNMGLVFSDGGFTSSNQDGSLTFVVQRIGYLQNDGICKILIVNTPYKVYGSNGPPYT